MTQYVNVFAGSSTEAESVFTAQVRTRSTAWVRERSQWAFFATLGLSRWPGPSDCELLQLQDNLKASVNRRYMPKFSVIVPN
jgi:hypothetical protein